MTMSKPQSVNTELQAIIASIHYLEAEADRIGLEEISIILKRGLTEIEKWANGEASDFTSGHDVTNSDLYSTLLLITEVSKLRQVELRLFLEILDSYDAIRSAAN